MLVAYWLPLMRFSDFSQACSLLADEENPRGDKLKGWTLAVFWKHECKFFDGIVIDYDGDLDQHTIHYSDGTILLVF